MQRKDAEAVPWMAGFRRNPWPKKMVWQQDDVVHRRFYWLRVPEASAIEDRALMTATVVGQEIRLDGKVPRGIQLRLSDALLDLDKPVRVLVAGRKVFDGAVPRRASVVAESLSERLDLSAVATALLALP
jgi:hypothetical protein